MLSNDNPLYFFWNGKMARESCVAIFQTAWLSFKVAKIEDGHSHRFRDTFAVEYLKTGMSIESVSKLLGHKSIEVTQRHYNMADFQPTTGVQ